MTSITRSRLSAGVLAAVTALGALVAAPAAPASAADTCPAALPTGAAVDGVIGTGYTVERGTTPEAFDARILGRVTDGIAPGIDMIMAELSSPAITRAGGVWQGMSGSPVYTADGRLIGSVSYGLAASSPIAGLTPGENLLSLLTSGAAAAAAPGAAGAAAGPARVTAPATRIGVSSTQARQVARAAGIGAGGVEAGFVQLKVPVSVSGATRFDPRFLSRLTGTKGLRVRLGGGTAGVASGTGPSSPTEIRPGGNLAAALSYGDVSISAVGTATIVCDGQVVAFGHPLLGLGAVQYTMHPATAVYIQPDPTNGPFKVADPGGPVGVVDQDRTLGLHAALGAPAPYPYQVTTSLAAAGAAPATGATTGVYQPWAADIAALHLQGALNKALGFDGAGSAALTFTVTGETVGGTPFSVTRSNHYTDPDSIAYAASDDLYNLVGSLIDQPFKRVRINQVAVTGSVDPEVQQYRVTAVKVLKSGTWVPQRGAIVATAGTTITRQVTLARYRSSSVVTTLLKVQIPAGTSGATGTLSISDGLSADITQPDPASWGGLLASVTNYAPNDAVAGSLSLDGLTSVRTVTFDRLDAVVATYARVLDVVVR